MQLTIPEFSLVVLAGPSGAGKSTFARNHFQPTEVLSSDFCRGLVADDENCQAATQDAFAVLQFIAARRLAAMRLTVVDATNVTAEDRKSYVQLAREYDCLPVIIVLNPGERACRDHNANRPDRDFGPHVLRRQQRLLRAGLHGLEREGFRQVHVLSSAEKIAAATVERTPLWNNLRHLSGPFDIIGDVHGCRIELEELLEELGYNLAERRHPEGRQLIFLGDLVDRGPDVVGVLRLVLGLVEAGVARCVPGNHEAKLLRHLRGKQVSLTHGLDRSVAALAAEPEEFRRQVAEFIDGLVSHYVLDDGRLVVAHGGMPERFQGRASGRVREFALYGDTTGETDEFGLPVRLDWAADYRGRAAVVYGHTPVGEAEWYNHTINLDTGCVFGGGLTALRWPEREVVTVAARQVWCEPTRPLPTTAAPEVARSDAARPDDLLDLAEIAGRRTIETRLLARVTLRAEQTAAALEVLSRFGVDPHWLVHLPPTMSPAETSREPGLLEHPLQAFDHYRQQGVGQVVCEEKHMGSRTILVVCRDPAVARRRFGLADGSAGSCYTRTGRRFFEEAALEEALLDRVRTAADQAGLWAELQTDWLLLDCELLPWSLKAQQLLRSQYATVGAAARAALAESCAALEQAAQHGLEVGELLARTRERADLVERYVAAYRRYCWPVTSLDDLRLAPFHLLASEGRVHVEQDHRWHLERLGRLCDEGGPVLLRTPHRVIRLEQPAEVAEGVRWWEELTGNGGEGMVVKPSSFLARGRRGLVQPAVKCRGAEYLRIIYGPEYTQPANLARLRSRGLAAKRALALREFALGIEALERFVRHEPLRRVHECVFGVLALESEPVDPRL